MDTAGLSGDSPTTRRELRERERAPRSAPRGAPPATPRSTPLGAPRSASKQPQPGHHHSPGRQALSIAAMSFIMLLTVGVSIPANAFSTPSSDAAIAASAPARTQSASVQGADGAAAAARDTFSVTVPVVEKVTSVFSSAGEPSVSGVSFIPAPGPVLWPTDVSPQIGRGVTNSHHGQDLLVAQGTPVHAIADGTVMVSGIEGSYGQYVVIQSDVGGHVVTSLYAHMGIGSQTVSAGETVTMGQTIGAVGSSGSATGYLLYLRILQDGALCDTVTFIAGNPAGGAAPH